jgi:DNA mismatch repair protein MutS2
MDDRSLKALDFYPLLDLLKEFSTSPLGRKRCEGLRPSTDLEWIQARLAEVMEMKALLETTGDLPIQGLQELEPLLRKLEVEEAVLTVQELIALQQQIGLSEGIQRFFRKYDTTEIPRLQERVSKLSSLKSLEKEIRRTIDPKGELLDEASPRLKEIRVQIHALREKVRGVLEHLIRQEEWQVMLQDQFVTIRNERYVLPLKSDYKNQLQGIVHDQSQTRLTVFFEPLQVVDVNNQINLLIGEERDEEYRILAALSRQAREEIRNLWSDYETLGDLDFLYAAAKFSIRLRSTEPFLNGNGLIDMRKARHPLLVFQKEEAVVPIELRMGDGVRTLIISGANAGGKTVALKSLGLLTLMAQSGLPVPVSEGSSIATFPEIFALVGDEQNIEQNLSTFSSHLLHLNQILEKTSPRSLVLLDELGVGTHASEGCALAMGFLDRFREIGATTVVTTHFDGLKAYGYLYRDVENVAVEFDEETFTPRYTLAYGSSGQSQAFLIAGKLGVSEKVLERARHYHEGGGEEIHRILGPLEQLKADVQKERHELLEMKAEVAVERQKLKGLIDGIKKKRQEIVARAEERLNKVVHQVEEELKEWVRREKEERRNLPKTQGFNIQRKEIYKIKEKFLPSARIRRVLGERAAPKVGDRVRVESLRSQGILVKLEEPLKRVEVLTEKGRIKASLDDLVKVGEPGEEETSLPAKTIQFPGEAAEEVSSELNVIGLTVEDALPEVDRFIDQALLHGLEKVRIIHGFGSGRLRNAIGKYLKEHRRVMGFTPGDPAKGGGGVTLVELA